VSPGRYELGFYIPKDGVLHSHRSENLKSYRVVQIFHYLVLSVHFYLFALFVVNSFICNDFSKQWFLCDCNDVIIRLVFPIDSSPISHPHPVSLFEYPEILQPIEEIPFPLYHTAYWLCCVGFVCSELV
jgi:hypothetical protein